MNASPAPPAQNVQTILDVTQARPLRERDKLFQHTASIQITGRGGPCNNHATTQSAATATAAASFTNFMLLHSLSQVHNAMLFLPLQKLFY